MSAAKLKTKIFVLLITFSAITKSSDSLAQPPSSEDFQYQLLFAHKTDACQLLDVPDAPFRAFRRDDEQVFAIAANYINWGFLGPSLMDVKRNCRAIYVSEKNGDPSKFNYQSWITSTWTFDGKNVAALAHEEFHGNEVPGACAQTKLRPCWYNAVVLLASSNSGSIFERVDKEQALPVAASYFDNRKAEGEPRGYFDPTNMIEIGNYVYALIGYNGLSKSAHGFCLVRSHNPIELATWEIYKDGQYKRLPQNPFVVTGSAAEECSLVQGLDGVVGSIRKVRGTNWIVASSLVAMPDGGGRVILSYSTDLIKWGNPATALSLPAFWSDSCKGGYKYNYPSLMDESSKDRNFSDVGPKARLFLTRAACPMTLDRDLVSFTIPIQAPISGPNGFK